MFDDEGVPADRSGGDRSAGPDRADTPSPVGDQSGADAHLREVVRYIAGELVDEPDAVEVSSRQHHQTVSLSLRVADGELGKIIGRQGRTARAIRTAVQIAGARHDVRVSLDIEG